MAQLNSDPSRSSAVSSDDLEHIISQSVHKREPHPEFASMADIFTAEKSFVGGSGGGGIGDQISPFCSEMVQTQSEPILFVQSAVEEGGATLLKVDSVYVVKSGATNDEEDSVIMERARNSHMLVHSRIEVDNDGNELDLDYTFETKTNAILQKLRSVLSGQRIVVSHSQLAPKLIVIFVSMGKNLDMVLLYSVPISKVVNGDDSFPAKSQPHKSNGTVNDMGAFHSWFTSQITHDLSSLRLREAFDRLDTVLNMLWVQKRDLYTGTGSIHFMRTFVSLFVQYVMSPAMTYSVADYEELMEKRLNPLLLLFAMVQLTERNVFDMVIILGRSLSTFGDGAKLFGDAWRQSVTPRLIIQPIDVARTGMTVGGAFVKFEKLIYGMMRKVLSLGKGDPVSVPSHLISANQHDLYILSNSLYLDRGKMIENKDGDSVDDGSRIQFSRNILLSLVDPYLSTMFASRWIASLPSHHSLVAGSVRWDSVPERMVNIANSVRSATWSPVVPLNNETGGSGLFLDVNTIIHSVDDAMISPLSLNGYKMIISLLSWWYHDRKEDNNYTLEEDNAPPLDYILNYISVVTTGRNGNLILGDRFGPGYDSLHAKLQMSVSRCVIAPLEIVEN